MGGSLSHMASDRDPIREAHSQWLRHGWAAAADGMAMVTSLVRVQQLLMERIEVILRPLDLTFARYEVLRLLSFTQSIPNRSFTPQVKTFSRRASSRQIGSAS